MEQPLSLQQLSDRLERLESEMNAIRRAMAAWLRQRTPMTPTTRGRSSPVFPWADKQVLRREMAAFCIALSIHAEPPSIEELQRKMREAQLAPNELSQSIIEAREM